MNIIFIHRNICKGYTLLFPESSRMVLATTGKKSLQNVTIQGKKKLLQIHGNVSYDMLYRSVVDTPYSGSNIYQHTVQVYLDLMWKGHYPFRIYLTNRFGNSNLFRNFFNFSMQYNYMDFANRIRQQISKTYYAREADSLNKLQYTLMAKEQELAKLKNKWNSGDALQMIVEAKEEALRNKYTGKDTSGGYYIKTITVYGKTYSYPVKKDSTLSKPASGHKMDSINQVVKDDQKKLDSLEKEVLKLEQAYQNAKSLSALSSSHFATDMSQAQTSSALDDQLKRYHISDSSLPKGYKTLMAVKSVGIGKSVINYSELSAKNVSIMGANIEYVPGYYYALAAGTVDYRFVDYVVPNTPRQPVQYIGLVRFGKMTKKGNSVIFTWYTGKRQMYNAATALSAGSSLPNYPLTGITVEKKYKIGKHTLLVAEVAKSSSPVTSINTDAGKNGIADMLNLRNRTNEAFSLKATTLIPATLTTVDASVKKFGANFQSFSIFNYGSAQTAWSVKVSQPFWKRKLLVSAWARENDFVNPFLNTSYKSTSLLLGLQATLRIKKLPVFSLGYYPSSQFIQESNNQYTQTIFYTMMASASHFYKLGKVQMSSTAIYTAFYNRPGDSSFVYFNTRNFLLSQTVFMGKWNVTGNASVALNTSYELYVYEGSLQFRAFKWLSVGGGGKYNYQTYYDITQWGYTGNFTVTIPKIGRIQMVADKGFVPGPNKQLVPNNIGRLNYIKTF